MENPTRAGHRMTLIEVFIQDKKAWLNIGGFVTSLDMTENPDTELMTLLMQSLPPDYIQMHLAEVADQDEKNGEGE